MKKIILRIALILFLIFTLLIIGFTAEFLFNNQKYYIHEKNIKIPIYIYHNIVEQKTDNDSMKTTTKNIDDHIKILKKLGYQFLTYQDLIKYHNKELKIKKKSILMTLDDGHADNYYQLFPKLKKHKIPVTINLIDDLVGKENYLTWDQIKEMKNSGLVDFHTHGKYHNEPYNIETNKYVNDILEAHNNIEKHLNQKLTKIYTYPYGIYEKEKQQKLKEIGFIQNLADNRINKSSNLDLYKLHRIYSFNETGVKFLLKTIYYSYIKN